MLTKGEAVSLRLVVLHWLVNGKKIWHLTSADALQGGVPELMYIIYENITISDFLSPLTAVFAVRDSEKTLPIHHTNAIHIPPLSCLQHWKVLHFSCSSHGVLSLLWITLAFSHFFPFFLNSIRCECTTANCSLFSIPFLIIPSILFPLSAASEPLPNIFIESPIITLSFHFPAGHITALYI